MTRPPEATARWWPVLLVLTLAGVPACDTSVGQCQNNQRALPGGVGGAGCNTRPYPSNPCLLQTFRRCFCSHWRFHRRTPSMWVAWLPHVRQTSRRTRLSPDTEKQGSKVEKGGAKPSKSNPFSKTRCRRSPLMKHRGQRVGWGGKIRQEPHHRC